MDKRRKLTSEEIRSAKSGGIPLAMITAYDARTAQLLAEAGVDLLLVGDSLGMVFQGHASTRQVTLDQMVYHVRAVRRGASTTHIVADLPYNTYETKDQALRSAEALLAAGADSVKLEGAKEEVIRGFKAAGIPVMGHLGLLPQTAHSFKAQGRGAEEAERLLAEAASLEEWGCFAFVLECVTGDTAARMSRAVSIPVIGIGSGDGCDGQVLVINDLLGLTEAPLPRFVRTYADLGTIVRNAAARYVADVKDRRFPEGRHSYR